MRLLNPWELTQIDSFKIYSAGSVFYKNKLVTTNELAILINDHFQHKQAQPEDLLNDLKGQFGILIESPTFTLGIVDKIRSFPLFYSHGKLAINTADLIPNIGDCGYNEQGLLEFRMAGYTLGNKTILRDLFQIKPGHYYMVNNENNLCAEVKYFEFFHSSSQSFTRSILLDKINDTINESVKKTIAIANGRKIVIPLSAGLDSRLILGKLIEFNYKNIFCYTYGPKNIWEAKIAKKVANLAGVEWMFIELDYKDKKYFHSNERINYYKEYSGFCSIPSLADFYALKRLLDLKIIDTNCLIVNGQSGDFITGSHISKDIKRQNYEELLNKFLDKHFGLWTNLKTKENLNRIRCEINRNFPLSTKDNDKEIIAKTLELIECHERQYKYVVNGQRAYDYYNISWHLPLWSDEMLEFWRQIELKDKLKQNAYREYCLTYNPAKLFSISTKPQNTSLPLLPNVAFTIIKVIYKILGKDKNLIRTKYFNYFDKYYPYYPMLKYSGYLKDSEFHRHCVSYWVKYFLEENKIE